MKFEPNLPQYQVKVVSLTAGERVASLIDADTGIPVPMVLSFMSTKRSRTLATMKNQLYALKAVLEAANRLGIDLITRLERGKYLSSSEIQAIAAETDMNAQSRGDPNISASTYMGKLEVFKDLVAWSLTFTPVKPRFSAMALNAEKTRIESTMKFLGRRQPQMSEREPLNIEEIRAIVSAIGPLTARDSFTFAKSGFTQRVALRNWCKFLCMYTLGLRIAEVLKIRVDGLIAEVPIRRLYAWSDLFVSTSEQAGPYVIISRDHHNPEDSRVHEPGVKTAGRVLRAPGILWQALQAYLEYPQPLGRPRTQTPYLFVTRSRPLSQDMAGDVAEAIVRLSGVADFTWHSLRHTWTSRFETFMNDHQIENAAEILAELGGWTNIASSENYKRSLRRQQAFEALTAYQAFLEPSVSRSGDGNGNDQDQ